MSTDEENWDPVSDDIMVESDDSVGFVTLKDRIGGSSKAAAMVSPAKSKKVAKAKPSNAKSSKGKSIEQIYQKKSQLEHILLRPDSYIGSIEQDTRTIWVFDEETERMVEREISFVPGLYKIFDEILVNAADNKQRDQSMDTIKVTIDPVKNMISVLNTGKGIPVRVHREHNMYVPELIFGHLLTSSNYDDAQKKVTGGRNGYGAKLTNIFSKKFIVETSSSDDGLKFKQVFKDNMSSRDAPEISDSDEDWTKVTFYPDLEKFGMEVLDKDIQSLMIKRVYDLAGCTHKSVKVYLNGKRIKVKEFKDYVSLYLPEDGEKIRLYEKVNDRWEVFVSISDGHFQQVSFVNSISTWKGGSHVKYASDAIAKYVMDNIPKKYKSKNLKPVHIKNHMWIFVNALIENPTFDSQTKENLTSRAKNFGSDCNFSEKFLKSVVKSGLVENVLSWAKFKESKELKKNDGKKKVKVTGIPKLEDANKAGSKDASKCTLILTEGDSAKALALSGMSVVGRDYYGVFPLKGKLLNVRVATHNQIMKNQEITFLKKILGLQQGAVYDDVSSLRYGHVMIMTDQDNDGSHIKGLLINLFHHYWPSLLRIPGFLTQFITPIVKSTKDSDIFSFYTLQDYLEWREQYSATQLKKWTIKYYKGLGTSTSKEAKEYFRDIDRHQIDFEFGDESIDSDNIDLAFSKSKADQRKEWLANFVVGTRLEYGIESTEPINYTDFINKELIHFSMADNLRSIPCIMDGLKPGQRKIMFVAFKKKIVKDIKVGQLSGIISQMSAYHHGEMSLCSTIVNLAQDFVGSNNINLLQPKGQFGTRHMMGKDSASARYIFTCLSEITRFIYHPDDDQILKYLEDDGKSIEPQWYAPVIPMSLINGAEGIGTGWSTSVPSYSPEKVVENIRLLLDGTPWEELPPLHPWVRDFTGDIVETSPGSYIVSGRVETIDDKMIRITELPLKKSTESYKEFLESLVEKETIADFESNHTDSSVDFTVTLNSPHNENIEGLMKDLKLTSTMTTTNMVLFDQVGQLQRYSSPNEILWNFFKVRLEYYKKRKEALLSVLSVDVEKLQNKKRFIQYVISGQIVINNRKRDDILSDLKKHKFKPFDSKAVVQEEDEEGEVEASSNSFDYLLSMRLWNLSKEKIDDLLETVSQKELEMKALENQTPEQLWRTDLDVFLEKFSETEELRLNDLNEIVSKKAGARKKKVKKTLSKSTKATSDPKQKIASMFPFFNQSQNNSNNAIAPKSSKDDHTPSVSPIRNRDQVKMDQGTHNEFDLSQDIARLSLKDMIKSNTKAKTAKKQSALTSFAAFTKKPQKTNTNPIIKKRAMKSSARPSTNTPKKSIFSKIADAVSPTKFVSPAKKKTKVKDPESSPEPIARKAKRSARAKPVYVEEESEVKELVSSGESFEEDISDFDEESDFEE